MDQRVWTDSEYRCQCIDRLRMDNVILANSLDTARASNLSRQAAIEIAVIYLCEENKTLFDHAVDAESRATPRGFW